MRLKLVAALAVALWALLSFGVLAQQTPAHSIPIGKGPGVQGFDHATPSTTGQPLVSNGASSNPSFQALPPSGMATIGAGHVLANATGSTATPADTSATSWFDQAYCNTVGYVIVRFTGAWTCAKWIAANPVWWGADPTGSAFSDTAVAAALSASPNIVFPCGRFKFAAAIAYTLPGGATFNRLVIHGQSMECTVLVYTGSTDGIDVTLTAQAFDSFDIGHLTLATQVAGGGNGLSISYSHAGANAAISRIDELSVRQDGYFTGAHYWATGIALVGIGNINIDNVNVTGSTSAFGTAGAGTCIDIESDGTHVAAIINLNESYLAACNTAVLIGTLVQGVAMSEDNIGVGVYGVRVPSGQSQNSQLSIVNSQFGFATYAIKSESSFYPINLANDVFIQAPVYLDDYLGVTITGCDLVGTKIGSGTALALVSSNVATGTATIVGNSFSGDFLGFSAAAGAIFQFNSNSMVANTTNYSNSSTGTTNQIINNLGINPIGAATITPGTSPYTYQAGPSPETIYLIGGTVSAITTFGKTVATATSATAAVEVDLGPNEQVTTTYSVAPTMFKIIH